MWFSTSVSPNWVYLRNTDTVHFEGHLRIIWKRTCPSFEKQRLLRYLLRRRYVPPSLAQIALEESNKAWKRAARPLSSLKLAIGELAVIATLCAFGTFIEQGKGALYYIENYPDSPRILGFIDYDFILRNGWVRLWHCIQLTCVLLQGTLLRFLNERICMDFFMILSKIILLEGRSPLDKRHSIFHTLWNLAACKTTSNETFPAHTNAGGWRWLRTYEQSTHSCESPRCKFL